MRYSWIKDTTDNGRRTPFVSAGFRSKIAQRPSAKIMYIHSIPESKKTSFLSSTSLAEITVANVVACESMHDLEDHENLKAQVDAH